MVVILQDGDYFDFGVLSGVECYCFCNGSVALQDQL